MKRIGSFLMLGLCGLVGSLQAQVNNSLLEYQTVISDSTEERVMLSMESRSFFRNNEYFGQIATGYTLMGTQLIPQLAYQAGKHIRLQGGVFLQSDFGNQNLRQTSPVLTLKMQKNGYSFLFGTLEGNLSHRLLEPLYNYERYMQQPLENGLQIKVDKPRIWSDTWLNWEVMQYLGSPYQERFSAGHSSVFTLVNQPQLKVRIPVQGLVTHRGGQIDTVSTPLETLLNASAGFSLSWYPGGFFRELRTDNYAVLYRDLSPSKQTTFTSGGGFYLNATAVSRYDVSAMLAYWKGNTYYSGRGAYLFQSIASSYGTKGFVQRDRSLLFLRLLYQKPVYKGLSVDVRFEPYYDLGSSLFEYSYALFLTYKRDFELFNLSKRK